MAKKIITKDTTLNKEPVLTVRISARQDFELRNIARTHNVKVSGIIRGLVDRLIEAHDAKQR